ncbi:MAG TPA: RDD family protein [Candidatus Acidoferrales bacterium]|nr:RDD family protein [Candidatus Acidoferrales bacterium]
MNRPQRKNGPVLIACQKCGAANDEHAQVCYVCDTPYDHPDEDVLVREPAQKLASAPQTEPESAAPAVALQDFETDLPPAPEYAPLQLSEPTSPPEPQPIVEVDATPVPAPPREPAHAFQPEWKREVVHRLEAYRARRQRYGVSDTQPHLPFQESNGNGAADPAEPAYHASLHTAARAGENSSVTGEQPAPPRRRERMEGIEVPAVQPEFNFVLVSDDHEDQIHPHAPLVPVAEVRERRIAGLLDAIFLALSYAGFLILFRALGGQLSIGRQEALVYTATLFIFYALYFGLFTALGGTTPGMYFRGLAVVGFDGEAASARQLLWRSFGYVLSAGTLMLGFVWAMWDEDHLTWQDRISQTYITPAPSPMWRDLSGEEPMAYSSANDNSSCPDAT